MEEAHRRNSINGQKTNGTEKESTPETNKRVYNKVLRHVQTCREGDALQD